MVNATPRPLYPRGRTPLPTVPENGWAPGLVWAAMEKRKSLGPHRCSNPQRVAILKAPSWPLTRDSWHHRESDLKIMKPGHVNRTGFMTPSSLPPTEPTRCSKIGSQGRSDKNTTRAARSYIRLRPACQRPACTRFHALAGDWRFYVVRDSDRLATKWRHCGGAVCFCWRIVP
jgi:hypothetical protein